MNNSIMPSSPKSNTAQLNQLKEVLRTLQSVEIPKRYQNVSSSSSNNKNVNAQPLFDKETLERYHKVRDTYIKSRMEELFLKHVSTFDSSTNTFQFPPQEQEQDPGVAVNSEIICKELKQTVLAVNDSYLHLHSKYDNLFDQRKELERKIQDLEKSTEKENDDGVIPMEEDDDDDDVDGERVLEEERLKSLMYKRNELEAKLRTIRAEQSKAKLNIEKKRKLIQELRKKDATDDDDEQEETAKTVEEMEEETMKLRERTQQLRDMSQWYDSIRCAMEELSNIRIIGIQQPPPSFQQDKENDTPAARRLRRSSGTSTMSHNNVDLYLKLKLMDEHILQIGLVNSFATQNNSSASSDTFRVKEAEILTPTVVKESIYSGPEFEKGNSNQDADSPFHTVQAIIPQPTDLVELCQSLEPVEDIRLIIRETMARIRAITSRVEELAKLRTKYLTKINSSACTSYGYGGEDQEIVCSINDGISVVLRLSTDCPLLPGSVYIQQIVGVGGWDQSVLERWKVRLNGMKHKTPVHLMDALVDTISKVKNEGKMPIPVTPNALPKRKKRG